MTEPATPAAPNSIRELIAELQRENLRLQRLVGELLLKNQQLRNCHETH